MTLGDQVAVLKDGKLQQADTPQKLFDAPVNLFVATFIGSPAMNLTEGRLIRDDGGLAVVFSGHKVPVPHQAIAEHPGLERFQDRQVIIGVRPSSLEDATFAPRGWPQIKAEARVTEKLGSEVDVIFLVKSPGAARGHGRPVRQGRQGLAARRREAEPTQCPVGAGESLWTARVNPKTSARPGRAIDLAVDTSALYWFDPDSGQAIARQAAGDRPGSLQDAMPPAAVA
jgi:multiple sugar transport system ATP-binding protein